jgi:hypothetical protein
LLRDNAYREGLQHLKQVLSTKGDLRSGYQVFWRYERKGTISTIYCVENDVIIKKSSNQKKKNHKARVANAESLEIVEKKIRYVWV